jgi:hypothetical protein
MGRCVRQMLASTTGRGSRAPVAAGRERERDDRHVRELGVQRILFGSDAPTEESFAPKAAWAAFRTLPLTDAEFQTIAANVPPYTR